MGTSGELDERTGAGIKGGEMNTERDKFLTEAIGECWHDPDPWLDADQFFPDPRYACCGVSKIRGKKLIDFSTWDGFGKLWTWAQEQEWFDLFQCCLYYHEYLKHCHRPGDERLDNDKVLHNELIHPDRFADAVYNFLSKK